MELQDRRGATRRGEAGANAIRACLTAAGIAMLSACGGGQGQSPSSAFEPTAALTLAWDQPDQKAQYYIVRSGATMVRVEQTRATLTLTTAPHLVEVTSCNDAGCSAPTTVGVAWVNNGWVLASP